MNKKLLVVALVLIVVTSLLLFFVLRDRSKTVETPTVSKTSSGHDIVAGDWITYEDSTSKLKIDYPADWYIYKYPDMYHEFGPISEQNYYTVVYLQQRKADFCDGDFCAPGEHASSIKIAFRAKKSGESVANMHVIGRSKLEHDSEGSSVAENTTIAGVAAVKYWDECQDLGCFIEQWDLENNDTIITITNNYAEDFEKKTFDEIRDRLSFAS